MIADPLTDLLGIQLVTPLRRLVARAGSTPSPAVTLPAQPSPRTLDLDAAASTGPLAPWLTSVAVAAEPSLLLDGAGRVAAVSASGAALLGLERAAAVGRLLVDLVVPLDFTSAAAPEPDPERALPPLRVLRAGSQTRCLLRVRRPDGEVATCDVVAVPVGDRAGVLTFLQQV